MADLGKHITVYEWIHAGSIAVRVAVQAVVPHDDPSEPCFEPPVIKHLHHLQQLAQAGDVDELAKHGEVYIRRSA